MPNRNRHNPQIPQTQFFLLDMLRGFAALWVFAFHFDFSSSFQTSLPSLHALLKLGELGVPMFFVISGYCITASARSALRRELPTRNFVYRRLKRIFPPFWCSIVAVALLPFLIEFISSLKTGEFVVPSASSSANYGYVEYGIAEWCRVISLMQIFWSTTQPIELHDRFSTINAVYWTLAIEVQFYLVVALAMKCKAKWFYPVLFVLTIVSIGVASFGLLVLTGLCFPFWPMFALGVLLFFVHEKQLSFRDLCSSWATSFSVALALTSLVAFLVAASLGFRPQRFIFTMGLTVWLWIAKPADELLLHARQYRLLNAALKPFVVLGTMSYSVYLLHGQLHLLTGQMLRQVVSIDSILYDLFVISGTCMLCWPFYKLCEEPFFAVARSELASKDSLSPDTAIAANIALSSSG